MLRLYPNPAKWHAQRRLRGTLAFCCFVGVLLVVFVWHTGQGLSALPSYCQLIARMP